MKTTRKSKECKDYFMKRNMCGHHHTGSAFYGLGFVGAAVYYISTSTGFWNGVLGFLKAIFWPAFLVHGLLKLIGA